MLSRQGMASGTQISPNSSQADLQQLTDYDVLDSASESIGKVSSIWVDRGSQMAFLGVQTGWLSGKTHVVPAQDATVNYSDHKIRLAYLKSDVKSAPVFDPNTELNFANESEVVSYFRKRGPALPELKGMGIESAATYPAYSSAAASATAAPTLQGESLQREVLRDANIPLCEEQLKVSKREVGAGGVRLHKIVRSERVQQGVDLRHEELVVERIPGKDLKVGAKAFQDEEFFIPLRQEEAVIEKEARVREQFHAHKADKMEHKTVSGDCRKEDIEITNQDESRVDLRSDQRARR